MYQDIKCILSHYYEDTKLCRVMFMEYKTTITNVAVHIFVSKTY